MEMVMHGGKSFKDKLIFKGKPKKIIKKKEDKTEVSYTTTGCSNQKICFVQCSKVFYSRVHLSKNNTCFCNGAHFSLHILPKNVSSSFHNSNEYPPYKKTAKHSI